MCLRSLRSLRIYGLDSWSSWSSVSVSGSEMSADTGERLKLRNWLFSLIVSFGSESTICSSSKSELWPIMGKTWMELQVVVDESSSVVQERSIQ